MPITTAGRNALVQGIVGSLSPAFNNANAALGVGNSATAFTAGQTDLVGASKTRKGMDATFPSVATNVITAQATFGTGDANHAWQEVGFFNNTTLGAGTMLSRVVVDLGTKTSASTFVLTYTLTVTLA
jgi:hypothetical protein